MRTCTHVGMYVYVYMDKHVYINVEMPFCKILKFQQQTQNMYMCVRICICICMHVARYVGRWVGR